MLKIFFLFMIATLTNVAISFAQHDNCYKSSLIHSGGLYLFASLHETKCTLTASGETKITTTLGLCAALPNNEDGIFKGYSGLNCAYTEVKNLEEAQRAKAILNSFQSPELYPEIRQMIAAAMKHLDRGRIELAAKLLDSELQPKTIVEAY